MSDGDDSWRRREDKPDRTTTRPHDLAPTAACLSVLSPIRFTQPLTISRTLNVFIYMSNPPADVRHLPNGREGEGTQRGGGRLGRIYCRQQFYCRRRRVDWTGRANARHVDGSDVVTWNPTISETAWGRRKPATVCRFNSKQSPPAATTLSTSNRRA